VADRVLVFVDALPWAERERIQAVVPELDWARAVRPGFGYSVNVKSELFAGKTPDDVGFLNEWTHSPGRGIVPISIPPWVERVLPGTSLPGRVLRKVLGRMLGENVRNIPIHLLSHLGRAGENAYEREYAQPSLFTACDVDCFLYSEHGGDDGAVEALHQKLRSSSEPLKGFLATAHLDHVMHAHGVGSDSYEEAVEGVVRMLAVLWESLKERGPDSRLALVSDHGMANVERSVTIDLEGVFPGAGKLYGYFVDATMLRVWCEDAELLARIRGHIEAADLPGRILAAEERERWGVASSGFGDVLLLLDEGVMFAPGFMGRLPAAAMHGYLPTLPSQEGLFMASGGNPAPASDEAIDARDVYEALRSFYQA
jgi:hypothetical protein